MQTVIRKWGNSLGVRIPKVFSEKISIRDGSTVDIEIKNHTLVIKPKDKIELKDLLLKVTEENIHKEISYGKPEGNEVW
ncbi:MAG: multidrug transporter MatE [Ignavibacteria bacterium]|nr:multidrug transporter MatE [Ignavibacteria bacterium]